MELRRYYLLFRTKWWVIAGTAVVFAVAAYLISTRVLPKEYTAVAKFEVSMPTVQNGQSLSPGIVGTDAELLSSMTVARQTVNNLHMTRTLSPSALKARTSCAPSETAQTVTCSLTYKDPVIAARLLSELGRVAINLNRSNQSSQLGPLLNRLNTRIAAVQADLTTAQKALASASSPDDRAVLTARIDSDNTSLSSLETEQATLQQTLAAQGSSLFLLDAPQVPTAPSSPRPVLNSFLALLLGLIVSSFGVLLADYLDDSPRSETEVATAFDAPILGSVRKVEGMKATDLPEVLSNPRSAMSEAFRMLRANIQFASADNAPGVLLVSSSQQGDGKTTVTTNLAAAMAEAGKRVILVDGDLRRPNLHNVFGLSNRLGLINLLIQPTGPDPRQCLQQGPTPNLSVLTSGPLPPNPSELLSSRTMRELLDNLRNQADMVIIDSAPVLAVADAVVLSTLADSVLIVTDIEKTRIHGLKQTRESLNSVGASILGVVINKLSKASHYYYYQYRKPYQQYEYAFEGSERKTPRASAS